jgi:hypothetical protein
MARGARAHGFPRVAVGASHHDNRLAPRCRTIGRRGRISDRREETHHVPGSNRPSDSAACIAPCCSRSRSPPRLLGAVGRRAGRRQRAVDAAKKQCAGKTITIVWEAGLQSLDPLNFSGPKWEQLTGCKVKVIEVPTAEMFTKIMQEYRAGTGAYDALNVVPAWMPDLVQAGRARGASIRTSTRTASATSCRRSRRPTATTR